MKGGPSANDFRISLEPATALGLYVLAFVERTEDPIGERLIGERPLQGGVSLFHQITCGLAHRLWFALLADLGRKLQGVAAVLLFIIAPGAGFNVYQVIFGLANAGHAHANQPSANAVCRV
ncbi:hypothetical protein [Ktedonobacter racemifer]|uniref:Uncharacterized protein n=1 Tax=Ktedonobacter racemifer DSM 44963 TaxID=485913 RepID=D6TCB9_KTERA|nr:hypothetical protein [Ktedonobacter racemifer]EFH89936.1 hypothetical protein Krac_11525 [Ktedonobacter racemifer DSM 44963]